MTWLDSQMASDSQLGIPSASQHESVALQVTTTRPDNSEYDIERTPSSSNGRISVQTCASLVCYIWYVDSKLLPLAPNDDNTRRLTCSDTPYHTRPSMHRPTASSDYAYNQDVRLSSRARLIPSDKFVAFVQSVLQATKVSDSIVRLSLYYIYKLKIRHHGLQGQPGSEYRLFLTSLILANKFLDDYTFTNETWSEVSHTPLPEITKMETQLFSGIGNNATLSPDRFNWWSSTLDMLRKQQDLDYQLLKWKENAAPMTFPSSPLSMTWSTNSSPVTTSILTPNCIPAATSQRTFNAGMSENFSLKKRKRSSQSDAVEPDDFAFSRRRVSSPYELDRLAMYASGYGFQQLFTPTTLGISMTGAPIQDSTTNAARKGVDYEQIKPYTSPRTTDTLFSDMSCVISEHGPSIPIARPTLQDHDQVTPSMVRRPFSLGYGAPISPSDLCGSLNLSPVNFAQPSASPVKLEYYQLASGHPYGIPAMMTLAPSANQVLSTTPHSNFARMPLNVNASHTALQAPHVATLVAPSPKDIIGEQSTHYQTPSPTDPRAPCVFRYL